MESTSKLQIVECVPNFSEGKDSSKIRQITDAIEKVNNVKLLNVELGGDTNRTVVTFVGDPSSVAEAAFQAIAKAKELIDMSKHKGTHPRIGATDVCPFIPVEGTSMSECIEIARKLGQRVGTELNIPVYLYEEVTHIAYRKNLSDIRRGEYESLKERLKDPKWKPDFGPTEFNPHTGATVIGARKFLIAYNITLNTQNKQYATDIAYELREKGRVARKQNNSPFYFKGEKLVYQQNHFPCGDCGFSGQTFSETKTHCQQSHQYDLSELLKLNDILSDNQENHSAYKSGKFKHCKAIGWYVDEYKRAQISINLTDHNVTPPHIVLEEVRKLAYERGIIVTGSEIIGLIPYSALLEAGKYYLKKQDQSTGVPIVDILNTAIFSMGLDDTTPFELEKKVIGMSQIKENALVKMNVMDFTDEVSRSSPAPGGGSIAALAGSLGAALAAMVANLSHGKEVEKDHKLVTLAEKAQSLKDELLQLIDEDTQAFNDYLTALRLTKNTEQEKRHRDLKIQEGLKTAIETPLKTAQTSFLAMELASEVINLGNKNSITDAATGVQMGFSGVRAGIWNVYVNLKQIINDLQYKSEKQKQCQELLAKSKILLQTVEYHVDALLLS
ncbi:MAG: glutamate formimidoyltransferase [Deltaproteobacteria bacterium]|nr:glutamate formimidoyltransferase [Deltaproteobacteria bacterium]